MTAHLSICRGCGLAQKPVCASQAPCSSSRSVGGTGPTGRFYRLQGHVRSRSTSACYLWESISYGVHAGGRTNHWRCAAASQDSTDTDADDEEERRMAALESGVKRRKGAQAVVKQQQQANRPQKTGSGFAEWKEGQLVPEGWESMSLSKKLAELYLGQRGVLFWATKATWAGVFVLVGAWVVFRVVGPALGLYTLTNDIFTPPNL